MKILPRRLAVCAALTLALWFGVGAWTAFVATNPSPRHVAPRERIENRAVETLEVRAVDGVRSVAWLVEGGRERCAILLAGIHGDRRATLPRAAFWLARGWSVLLVDLRGTGESDPRPISFGWNERLDVAAWVTRLRERGVRTIALHGQSLGAAAAVYAVADGAEVQLLVLDACYDDVQRALERRLPFVPFPRVAFFPVRLCVELRTGIAADQLRPIDKLKSIHAPTFFAIGSEDEKVGREAATALFEASPAAHRQLFWVEAARHEELWARHADAVAPALSAFLNAAELR